MTASTNDPREEDPGEKVDSLDPSDVPTIASDGWRVTGSAAPASMPGLEHPGTVIDSYTLVELLGEGGFGTVWRARQEQPVKREVALKVIKPGRDTVEVIARFEQERQSLAVMDHPNIAKVFDAGTTGQGRPYFVMELAPGQPVTAFCDSEQLDIRERLGVFLEICAAVRHAHQKGIIHRDLKPSNILVEKSADGPRVKVIDFGVAKALDVEEGGHEGFTLQGTLIGTPQYMSPEQTGMEGTDVDTRADIYSLGVILYELLTGVTPLDPKTLRQAGWEEVLRQVREREPAKPSTRLVLSNGEGGGPTAEVRATTLKKLTGILEGDLDWIALKALEKEPDRRYDTVNALAQDVRRHLANEPVMASPPSASYRVRKFARRNRALVGSLATIFVVVTTAAIVSTKEAIRANQAERDAIEQRDAADKAKAVAEERKISAESATTLADARADTIERNLYVAEMNLAAQSIALPSGIERVSELTRKWLPESDSEGRRGWEWFYLDAMTRQERTVIQTPRSLLALAWSPDGSKIAAAGHERKIRIWDADSLVESLPIDDAHTTWIRGLCWSPDGRMLASAADDGLVCLWDGESGGRIKLLHKSQNPKSGYSSLAWRPNGNTIASGGNQYDGNLRVWDHPTGELLFSREIRATGVSGLAWAPAGQQLAVQSSQGLKIFNSNTWEIDREFRDNFVARRLSWNPMGITIAAGNFYGEVRVLHSGDGKIHFSETAHIGEINAISWNPGGDILATGGSDHSIKLWSMPEKFRFQEFQGHTGSVTGIAWNPAGTMLASCGDDGSLRFWDVEKRKGESVALSASITALRWNSDDSALASADRHGNIHIWNFGKDESVQKFSESREEVWDIDWGGDNQFLVSVNDVGVVSVWDASGERQRWSESRKDQTTASADWQPDGNFIAVGYRKTGLVRILDSNDGSEVIAFQGTHPRVESVSWRPNGSILAAGIGSTVHFFDVGKGIELRSTVLPHASRTRSVQDVSWHPDGSRLAIATLGGKLFVLDGESGAILDELPGHNRSTAVAWSPDGSRLASGGADRMVRIWDPERGEQVVVLSGHSATLRAVAWSHDGTRLASAGDDRLVRIWDATKGYEAEEQRRKKASP